MTQLSANQIRIVRYIEDYQRRQPYPPTIREIAKGVGIRSTSNVRHHLERLVEMGRLKKSGENVSRCYFAPGIWIPRNKIHEWLETGQYRE